METLKINICFWKFLHTFFNVRLEYYGTRKAYLIDVLDRELIVLSNKAKYIQEVLNGTVDLRKKKKDEIIQMLQTKGYQKIVNERHKNWLKLKQRVVRNCG